MDEICVLSEFRPRRALPRGERGIENIKHPYFRPSMTSLPRGAWIEIHIDQLILRCKMSLPRGSVMKLQPDIRFPNNLSLPARERG